MKKLLYTLLAIGILIIGLWAINVISSDLLFGILACSSVLVVVAIIGNLKKTQPKTQAESDEELIALFSSNEYLGLDGELRRLMVQDGSSFSLPNSHYRYLRMQIITAQIQFLSMAIFQRIASDDLENERVVRSLHMITLRDFRDLQGFEVFDGVRHEMREIWDSLELYGCTSSNYFSAITHAMNEEGNLNFALSPTWEEMTQQREHSLRRQGHMSEDEVARGIHFAALESSWDVEYLAGAFADVIKLESKKTFPQMELPEDDAIASTLARYYSQCVERLSSLIINHHCY